VCGQNDDGEITVHIYQDKDATKHGYDHLSYDAVVYEGCEYEGVPVLSVKTACDLYGVESATSYDMNRLSRAFLNRSRLPSKTCSLRFVCFPPKKRRASSSPL
jgi:hypothetical protein